MDLERIQAEFHKGFQAGEEIGAALSVWKDGVEVLSLYEGVVGKEEGRASWGAESIVPVFSATKGPSAATFILCLEEAGMNLETEVQRVWREFPISGANFGEMISHQCGLCAVDSPVRATDYAEVIEAIQSQSPLWEPTTGHGYHPRLGGYMMDECVRRLTGGSLGEVWQKRIAEPLGIDFWIGLPESEDHRVATLYSGKMSASQMKEDPFYSLVGKADSIPGRAFRYPKGVQGAGEMNKPENWRAGYPAMGGVGSATGLAKFYQAALGLLPGTPFSESVREQFNTRLVNGKDLVFQVPTSFGGGFMMDPVDEDGRRLRHLMGTDNKGFGHPGAGGSHAFGDPATGYSFAYVMNQMEVTVLPGEKIKRMLSGIDKG